MVTEFSDYYERKEPRPGTLDLWFKKVQAIPDEPLKWITAKLFDENESFPRNFPAAIWAMFRAWQAAYPEKMVPAFLIECPDCSDGTIRAWRRNEKGIDYSYLFRCGRCKQSTIQAWPMMRKGELIADGYSLEPETPNGEQRHIPVDRVIGDLVKRFSGRAERQPGEEG